MCIVLVLALFFWRSAVSENKAEPVKPGNVDAAASRKNSRFDIQFRISWKRGPDAPIATMEGPSIQVGNQLFVMGGFYRALHATPAGNLWNLDTMKWDPLPPLPQSQSHVGIATDGKYLFLAGGQLGDYLSRDIRAEAYRFDIEKNSWSKFPPLPEPRLGGALLYWNGSLHYFGGNTTDRLTVSDKHWAIPVTGKVGWVEKAPLIYPGDHLGACVVNGKIYAIGGEHGHSETARQHDAVSEYDPLTDKWKSRAPLPEPASHFEAAVLNVHDRIVVLGGMASKGKFVVENVRIYDPVSDSWVYGTRMPIAPIGGVAAFYKDRLYYVAGRAFIDGKKRSWPYTWIGTIENPWW
jgi:hypothetical protein